MLPVTTNIHNFRKLFLEAMGTWKLWHCKLVSQSPLESENALDGHRHKKKKRKNLRKQP
jgi:hypothetical protein